ncbi:hypothetical protein AKO1_015173 [Acrasis kona]|uniref:Uncharacterized protein n=1 Tax=Acrasis kona TaxID=1008807 RepID=A0AAW2ZGW3_9EUKA
MRRGGLWNFYPVVRSFSIIYGAFYLWSLTEKSVLLPYPSRLPKSMTDDIRTINTNNNPTISDRMYYMVPKTQLDGQQPPSVISIVRYWFNKSLFFAPERIYRNSALSDNSTSPDQVGSFNGNTFEVISENDDQVRIKFNKGETSGIYTIRRIEYDDHYKYYLETSKWSPNYCNYEDGNHDLISHQAGQYYRRLIFQDCVKSVLKTLKNPSLKEEQTNQ